MRSSFVDACTANGTIDEVSLQPKGLTTADINNGSQDAYLTQLATDIKNWDHDLDPPDA